VCLPDLLRLAFHVPTRRPRFRTDSNDANCAYAILKLYTPHRSEQELVGGGGAVAKLRESLLQLPRHVQATLLVEPEEEEHEFADADNADDGGDDARAEEDAHAFGSDDMAWEADQQHSTREPAPASATATTSSAGVCMITSAERREWEGYIDNEAKLARDMKREQREQFTAAEASDVTGNASEYARISAFTHEQTERRDALLEDLSDKQREVRDALYHAFIADGTGDKVLLMVTGEAGTGKSRAIDVIVLTRCSSSAALGNTALCWWWRRPTPPRTSSAGRPCTRRSACTSSPGPRTR